jgi:hypothetical protein
MRASMTSRIHRVLWRVTISLALGAIVTVLVAWRCHRFAWRLESGTEIKNIEWPIAVPSTWPLTAQWAVRFEGGPRATEYFGAVLPIRPPQLMREPNDAVFGVTAYQSGWPCHACVRYVAHDGTESKPTQVNLGFLREGLPGPFQLQWSNQPNRNRLPILPLWPGFAINTLFYGALAFAAMAGVSAIRRRRRFKRGLCMQCAYPLTGGDICPECGMAVHFAAKSPNPSPEPVNFSRV